MICQPNYRQIVPSISEQDRPLWSVMIPTYNCAIYLRETLASVLAQDPGKEMMQIAVIDDCSSDNPEAVVEELGRGRVEFYRQLENVGVPQNFHTCLEKSRGYLVHQLHGDDAVREGFYQKMQKLFEQYPNIGAAFCRTIIMDEEGRWEWISGLERQENGVLSEDWLQQIADLCRIPTPSMVVRREVYEKLGGFDCRLRTTEDWEMWVRIAANYPIAHEVEPLALYRNRLASNMHSNMHNGRHAENMYKAIEVFESYLGDHIPVSIYQNAKQNCAFAALDAANACMNQGNFSKSLNQIRAAIKYRASFKVIRSATRIILQDGTRSLLKKVMGNGETRRKRTGY
jgi:glycosyltransferase involved in cell wall biosynthesis